MRRYRDAVFRPSKDDGINFLPKCAGLYCIVNQVNGKRYIGQAKNIYRRCLQHRNELRKGIASNMLMRRDAQVNGFQPFFFAVQLEGLSDPSRSIDFDQIEVWLVTKFRAHEENFGYNLEAGHNRTTGALFRDRERKLMRSNSDKYQMLPWVDMYDPIHPDLLLSWIRGG